METDICLDWALDAGELFGPVMPVLMVVFNQWCAALQPMRRGKDKGKYAGSGEQARLPSGVPGAFLFLFGSFNSINGHGKRYHRR